MLQNEHMMCIIICTSTLSEISQLTKNITKHRITIITHSYILCDRFTDKQTTPNCT